MDTVWPYLAAILPTILVAILFYFLIKSMLEGDRRERVAQRRFDAEQDRADGADGADRRGLPSSGGATTDSEVARRRHTEPTSGTERPENPGEGKDL